MQTWLTSFYLCAVCLLFQASAAEPTQTDREVFRQTKAKAEKGDAEAQVDIGLMYEKGEGVEQDTAEAVKWYRRAAEQNHPSAQSNLGAMYAEGRGVEKNAVEAVNWYRKAAEQRDTDAQFMLGQIYSEGLGVGENALEAVKWYRMAAEDDHWPAQFNLGLMYTQGRGVEKDAVEGYAWINLSAKTVTANAKYRDNIEERMTPQQVADGQKRTKVLRAMIEAKARVIEKRGVTSGEDADAVSPSSSGTGFFISDDGYLVTNHHVANEGAIVRVVTAAGTLPATVVKVDMANDFAVLKVVGKFEALPVASSRTVKLGDTVATVGFPNPGLQGFLPKLAKGDIASLAGAQDDPRHFQISAPIQPGNSGGALVDARGNVVGVVVAKLSQKAAIATTDTLAENVNYAVKSSFLLSFLESLPNVVAKLKEPNTKDQKFENVVKSAQ